MLEEELKALTQTVTHLNTTIKELLNTLQTPTPASNQARSKMEEVAAKAVETERAPAKTSAAKKTPPTKAADPESMLDTLTEIMDEELLSEAAEPSEDALEAPAASVSTADTTIERSTDELFNLMQGIATHQQNIGVDAIPTKSVIELNKLKGDDLQKTYNDLLVLDAKYPDRVPLPGEIHAQVVRMNARCFLIEGMDKAQLRAKMLTWLAPHTKIGEITDDERLAKKKALDVIDSELFGAK